MKYTKEERLVIGRRIYDGEVGRYEAAEEYDISDQTARDYMRLYRTLNQLPPKNNPRNSHAVRRAVNTPSSMEEYEALTKEELIHELVKARVVEARLKRLHATISDRKLRRPPGRKLLAYRIDREPLPPCQPAWRPLPVNPRSNFLQAPTHNRR